MTTRIQSAQNGSFELPISAKEAFPLFSAEGERKWISGWSPTAVLPAGPEIAFATDAVWQTMHGAELANWWTIEADHLQLKADYVYFMQSRAARVTVCVHAMGESTCRVEVRYVHVSLKPEGDAYVRSQDEAAMKQKMHDWKEMIETSLVC